jgi:glucosylceramidase
VAEPTTNALTYVGNYYYMTHFSRYVRPGAVRIGCTFTDQSLEMTAVKNQNGAIVVAVLNKGNAAVTFKLKQGTQIVKPVIPAHSLVNFIY